METPAARNARGFRVSPSAIVQEGGGSAHGDGSHVGGTATAQAQRQASCLGAAVLARGESSNATARGMEFEDFFDVEERAEAKRTIGI